VADQVGEETAEVPEVEAAEVPAPEVEAAEVPAADVAVESKSEPEFEETPQLTVYQSFPEAIVTTEDGQIVDIETILPTRVQARSGFDVDAFDGVYVEQRGLSSGKIEWREVAVQGRSAQLCNARSNLERRPRFVVLSTGTTTITSSIFSTIFSTAPSTVTFRVSAITCTSSGFSFAVPNC